MNRWMTPWAYTSVCRALGIKAVYQTQPIAAAMQDWLFYDDTKVVSERQGSRTLEELDISIELCR